MYVHQTTVGEKDRKQDILEKEIQRFRGRGEEGGREGKIERESEKGGGEGGRAREGRA